MISQFCKMLKTFELYTLKGVFVKWIQSQYTNDKWKNKDQIVNTLYLWSLPLCHKRSDWQM